MLSGVTTIRVTGPGPTSTAPLRPVSAPADAWTRMTSAFVYVSVARGADPPELITRLVVPRAPPRGAPPSTRRAARVTVPVQPVIVAFGASFAVAVTLNDAPAVALA